MWALNAWPRRAAAPNDCSQRSSCCGLLSTQHFRIRLLLFFYYDNINISSCQQPSLTNKPRKTVNCTPGGVNLLKPSLATQHPCRLWCKKRHMSYLFRGLGFNKNCINIFGFGQQLCLRISGLVFFTGQPELNVFFTELCPEELREGFHPIWCKETETEKHC